MSKPCLSKTIEIRFKPFSRNKLVLAAYLFRESIGIPDIIQNGEEDDEQFLIKVYLAFLVYGIQINWLPVLDYGIGRSDGTHPIYFIQAAVHILYDGKEKTLVVFIELNQRKKNIQIGIAQPAPAVTHLRNLRVVDNLCIITLIVFINHDGAVNPYGKLIQEVTFNRIERIVFIKICYFFRSVFTEH